MSRVDLRKLALRLKILEMLRIHADRRRLMEAASLWRHMVQPN